MLLVDLLLVLPVVVDEAALEAIGVIVRALLDDVGPEHPGGAREAVGVDVEQRGEIVAGREQQLETAGHVLEAAQDVPLDVIGAVASALGDDVVDPVVAALVHQREPGGQDVVDHRGVATASSPKKLNCP